MTTTPTDDDLLFDHERLGVYKIASRFFLYSEETILPALKSSPKKTAHVYDQIARASTSIILNIAEGAGKFSRGDKRRYYLSALGSTTECAAILDIVHMMGLIDHGTKKEGRLILVEIVRILTAMCRNLEKEPEERDRDRDRERDRDRVENKETDGSKP